MRWVTIKTSEGDQLKPFSSAPLPEYNQAEWKLGASEPGWQLAPFWQPASEKRRDPRRTGLR